MTRLPSTSSVSTSSRPSTSLGANGGSGTIAGRFSTDYPLVISGLFLASVPPIIAYILLQRFIRRGLVLGAVK